MPTNSVRIQAEKLCAKFSKASCQILTSFRCAQIPVRNSVEFGVALDAHKLVRIQAEKMSAKSVSMFANLRLVSDAQKFSNDSCGKIVHNFQ